MNTPAISLLDLTGIPVTDLREGSFSAAHRDIRISVAIRFEGEAFEVAVSLMNHAGMPLTVTPAVPARLPGAWAELRSADRRMCNGDSALGFGMRAAPDSPLAFLYVQAETWDHIFAIHKPADTLAIALVPLVELSLRPVRRSLRATFAAAVRNDGDSPVLCSFGERMIPEHLWVEPHSMADVRLRFRGLALRLSSITMRARAAALDRRITVRVPWWMRVRGPVLSLLSVAAATSAIVLHPRSASAPRIVAASPAPRTAIRPRPRPAILHHAEIRSLDVAPAFARSGNDMIVSYDARGAGGMLTVLDDNGIEKGRYPYNPAGATHIAAPPVDKPAHFRVMLEMRDGSAHARETLGFIVMPSPQPSPAKAASTSGASNDPIANEPLRLGISPANVVSGAPFYVSAANGSGSLQVTLQDSRGTPVASASAASGKSATLTAPYLNSPKTYFLQVTVRRGKSAETLFQPLHIQPAAR